MNPLTIQRAIVQSSYGNARDVLSLSLTHPVNPPSSTQVQIRVHAASINPIDWQMIEGNRRLLVSRSFPFVPLFDLAGVVTRVGNAVTCFRPGDAVHADNKIEGGGASEFVNVEQTLVSVKPKSLDFAEAAALPLAAQTAFVALEKGGVGPGSHVCVIGASGGVGSFAVQIAKVLGAVRVVGVCSGKNSTYVKSLGADQILDYTRSRLHEALGKQSMDVMLDCVGGREQWLEARKVLRPRGKFITIARDEDGRVTLGSALALTGPVLGRKFRSFFGNKIQYILVFLDASRTILDRVNTLVEAGKLRIPVTRRYPFSLEGVLALIEESKRGRMVGKAVLEIIKDSRIDLEGKVSGH